MNFRHLRDAVASNCSGRSHLAFLQWTRTFQRKYAEKSPLALARRASHANVTVFAPIREADEFLRSLSR